MGETETAAAPKKRGRKAKPVLGMSLDAARQGTLLAEELAGLERLRTRVADAFHDATALTLQVTPADRPDAVSVEFDLPREALDMALSICVSDCRGKLAALGFEPPSAPTLPITGGGMK